VELTVQELAALVGGQFISGNNHTARITGAASLAEARTGDVTFFGNARYLAALKVCKATAALVPADFSETITPLAIRCENPTLAFSNVLEHFAPEPILVCPGGASIGGDCTRRKARCTNRPVH